MHRGWQLTQFLQLVLRGVKEGEVGQADDVFDLGDLVLGQIELLELFFTFKKWNVLKAAALQAQLFSILNTFSGSAVNYEDVRNLGKLNIDRQSVSLNEVNGATLDQVFVSLVRLNTHHPLNQGLVWLEKVRGARNACVVESTLPTVAPCIRFHVSSSHVIELIGLAGCHRQSR